MSSAALAIKPIDCTRGSCLYQATIEYLTQGMANSRNWDSAQSITIQFAVPLNWPEAADGGVLMNRKEAVAAVRRWWANRHCNRPSTFHKLIGVDMWGFQPREIDKDGSLMPAPDALIFQWKSVTGIGPSVTVGQDYVADPRNW